MSCLRLDPVERKKGSFHSVPISCFWLFATSDDATGEQGCANLHAVNHTKAHAHTLSHPGKTFFSFQPALTLL